MLNKPERVDFATKSVYVSADDATVKGQSAPSHPDFAGGTVEEGQPISTRRKTPRQDGEMEKDEDGKRGKTKGKAKGKAKAKGKGKEPVPLPPASTAFPDSSTVWQSFFRRVAQEFRAH